MRPTVAAIVAILIFTALAAPGLSGPAFLPEEGTHYLHSTWPQQFPSWVTPESALRLPGLVALTLAVGVLVGCYAARGAATSGLLLTAFSPALVTAGRTAGPLPWAATFVCLAAATHLCATRYRHTVSLALIAVAFAIVWRQPGSDPVLAAAWGLWGVVAGPTLPPWRLDVAPIVYLSACALAVLGTNGERNGRVGRVVALVTVVATSAALGTVAPRPAAAAATGGILSPLLGLFIAAGARRLPRFIPPSVFVTIVVAGSLVGVLNLRATRDLLDPARSVAWDETARMLQVLESFELEPSHTAAVIAVPDLPDNIRVYAPTAVLRQYQSTGDDARVLVLTHGLRGGLKTRVAKIEEDLEDKGYRLQGELLLGELEPGMAALVQRLTKRPGSRSYLRIRRFERPQPTLAN